MKPRRSRTVRIATLAATGRHVDSVAPTSPTSHPTKQAHGLGTESLVAESGVDADTNLVRDSGNIRIDGT